ncbi:beta-ketoacyl-ACP synthase III [Streptomyces sp. NPDC021093]|uniref:beta-ketoacyl-ACP synthase III n=1 Tax=Streptomyces sp. NPDC021093 TaxID=3365112 RepID=UPI0037895F39
MTHGTTAPAAPTGARILSVGAYRPAAVVTNEEISGPIDSSDEWIRRHSGIRTRRFAGPEETIPFMAQQAAAKALVEAGIDARQVSVVLLATMSYLYQTPAAAARVAHGLDIEGAAFDVMSACAGFSTGLALARDMIVAGTAEYVLVIGAERMSDLIDPKDRSTAFLFGDGAGAAVVGPSDDPADIGPVVWGSDGSRAGLIAQHDSWLDGDGSPGTRPFMVMDGPRVYRWAVTQIPAVARRAMDQAEVAADDLVAFVPHQANLRIIEAIVASLKLPEQVVVARDVVDMANTSAASIPLALERLRAEGHDPGGGAALLVGFGSGLSYAAQVVRLP